MRSRSERIIAAVLLTLIAGTGCSGIGPARLSDPAPTAGESENAAGRPSGTLPLGDAARPTEAGGKTIVLKTYRFGLEQAVKWALMNNLSLMNAGDQVTRAKFNVQAAAAEFEVKIVPAADASLSGGSNGSEPSRGAGIGLRKKTLIGTQLGISADTMEAGDAHTTGVALDLVQPLLRGLGREANKDGLLDARFGLLSSERSYLEYQEDLVVSVVRSFYEIIRQRELLELNEKSAERTRDHLKAAQARERVGLASRIDVLRAEIQLRQAQDNLLSAREAYGDALDGFRILLGFGPQDNVEIDAELSYREFQIEPEKAILFAMTNRLDLARARDEINETERDLRIAKNNTLPQLDLVLGYERFGTGGSFSDSSDFNEYTWTIGLATSTDVRRTAERARYEQAKLDVAAVRRNYQLRKDTVVREVKDTLRRLEKNRKRIDIQKADIEHAGQKQKLAKMRFDRGLADNFELIDAEEEIIRAETNHISAVTDYIISQAQLKKAIGTLIERPARLLR